MVTVYWCRHCFGLQQSDCTGRVPLYAVIQSKCSHCSPFAHVKSAIYLEHPEHQAATGKAHPQHECTYAHAYMDMSAITGASRLIMSGIAGASRSMFATATQGEVSHFTAAPKPVGQCRNQPGHHVESLASAEEKRVAQEAWHIGGGQLGHVHSVWIHNAARR